ncbi:MAG: hypothetical protein PHX51_07875, partial [Clostridia bacterium]|nr:hypothetical protein [Clostridia bacterium]
NKNKRLNEQQERAKTERRRQRFGKVMLAGERSSHVEKLVNELSGWGFFKYLFSAQMFKIIGLNIIMLLLAVAVVYLPVRYTIMENANTASNYPYSYSVGLGSQVWFGFDSFLEQTKAAQTVNSGIWMIFAFALSPLVLSGAFCVIRDSFWTGELKILKGFATGLVQTSWIMLPFMAALGGVFCLVTMLGVFLSQVLWSWLSIIIMIIVWAAFVLLAAAVMSLYAVVATYKQPLKQSISDAWILFSSNIIPNMAAFILSFAPLTLGVIFYNTGFGSLLLSLFMFLGFFFTAFVWMVHYMKMFRIFYPVQKKVIKKKKSVTVSRVATPSIKENDNIADGESAEVEASDKEQTAPQKPVVKYQNNATKHKGARKK